MFLSILKWSIISLTIIYLIHHLYMFFLNTLTVPKVKDLVNKPTEQYDEIFKTLQNSSSSDMINSNSNSNGNGNGNRNRKQNKHKNNETLSDDKMTEELSSFLNELKKNPTNNNNISNNNMNFSNSQGNEPSHILSANDIGLYSPY
jgi:hypothetical protein